MTVRTRVRARAAAADASLSLAARAEDDAGLDLDKAARKLGFESVLVSKVHTDFTFDVKVRRSGRELRRLEKDRVRGEFV